MLLLGSCTQQPELWQTPIEAVKQSKLFASLKKASREFRFNPQLQVTTGTLTSDFGDVLLLAMDEPNTPDSLVVNIENHVVVAYTKEEQTIALAAKELYGAIQSLGSIDTLTIQEYLESKNDFFSGSYTEGWHTNVTLTDADDYLGETIIALFLKYGSRQPSLSALAQYYQVFRSNVESATELSDVLKDAIISNLEVQYDLLQVTEIKEGNEQNEGAPKKGGNCLVKVRRPRDCETAYWKCQKSYSIFECNTASDCKKVNGDAGLYCDY